MLSKIGHLSWIHRRFCGFPVGLHEGHQLAMRGMSRLSPPPQRKDPFTVDLLRCMRSQLKSDSAHDRALWGAAVMGFFFMLKRSEYLADNTRIKNYAIQCLDVSFRTTTVQLATTRAEAALVAIHFRGGKADQKGVGATRTLGKSGVGWLCPVQACWTLVRLAKIRHTQDGELLCTTSLGTPLTTAAMTLAIKQAASRAGLDPRAYGTHSMRSGGATAMFGAGVDRLVIKHFGRWSLDCYEQYTRMDGLTISNLATRMVAADAVNVKAIRTALPSRGHSTPHPSAGVPFPL